ncbi:MAG: D-alanyl-D-alanine carboxypeptidase/D-alanyl-D-alanine-endopeptidase [Silicimonas sp.]|nr:D-alanyl-D-alanine carboxypeptidase/D-alanyl-D-alanine-endopeptidase [Silicimonas sp.]
MTRRFESLTRRGMLAGLLSTAGGSVLAGAPALTERPLPRGAPPPPAPVAPIVASRSEAIVKAAKLGGEVGFAVADAESGVLLEARLPNTPLPPASTLKVVTALYALDKLGGDHRFATRVLTTGPIEDGRIEGDLILAGGGDPTLDTDRLAELARLLREAGVTEVSGRFLLAADALPRGDRIDHEQPDHVAYNPAFGGLNLNFNRVHFQWEKQQDDFAITMHARGRNFSPATNVAYMGIIERKSPVFEYRKGRDRDKWTVAEWALGRDGARWLPVRFPALYAGDVFRTLARSNGIVLKPAEMVSDLSLARPLVQVESDLLVPMLQRMLKYSTNLTAEVSGMAASSRDGEIDGLTASGARMSGWATARFGVVGPQFRDHSGLGYASGIAPQDMVRILSGSRGIAPLLKTVNLSTSKQNPGPKGVLVRAKTGTLNFVSSLAGFVTVPGGRDLAFSIMTADTARRDAIPPAERERPPGSKSWARRSRRMQKELIREWAARLA